MRDDYGKQKTQTLFCSMGHLTMRAVSDIFPPDPKLYDTAIYMGDEYLMTVSGSEFDQFRKDLVELIAKYRI